jgi:predicted alpha/beta hydrolase
MDHILADARIGGDVEIVARDGYPLAATLTDASARRADAPVVIIGSATAVPRGYYRPFAEALATRGVPSVTFDYRGVAGSAPRPPMTLRNFPYGNRTWGTIDIPSVIDWVRVRFPGRPIHWVGHSFGGFGFGLADNNHHIARSVGGGTQVSSIAAQAYLAMPVVTRLAGKLPGRALGGADLPGRVAREWAQWLRSPTMFFGDRTLPETANFKTVRADILLFRITDDPWATDLGAQEWQRRFVNANVTIERVRPQNAGVSTIGHIAYFKPRFRDSLWPRALDWVAG